MVLVLEVTGSTGSLSLPWLGVGGHGDVGLGGGGGWLAAWAQLLATAQIANFGRMVKSGEVVAAGSGGGRTYRSRNQQDRKHQT